MTNEEILAKRAKVLAARPAKVLADDFELSKPEHGWASLHHAHRKYEHEHPKYDPEFHQAMENHHHSQAYGGTHTIQLSRSAHSKASEYHSLMAKRAKNIGLKATHQNLSKYHYEGAEK